jgi:hypothetical protein
MRLVLQQVRDDREPPELKEYEELLVVYNAALLVQDKCIEGAATQNSHGEYVSVNMLGLTSKGHDLLEKLEREIANQSGHTPNVSIGKSPRNFPMDIFISHSSKDVKLAAALVELIRNALNISVKKIRCTSVDGFRLEAGKNVDEEIRKEVHGSKAFIGLITPVSIESAYVLFELGARWVLDLHLAPLLGSGADASYLRGPLSNRNALTCDEPAQIHQLIDELAKLLQIDNRTPPSAYQKNIDSLVQISRASKPSNAAMPVFQKHPADDRLPKESEKMLLIIADGDEKFSEDAEIQSRLGLSKARGKYLFNLLEEGKLVHYVMGRVGQGGHYYATSAGLDYLAKHKLI